MVSAKKIQTVKDVKHQIKDYHVIGVLDMQGLPARQNQGIRKKLKGHAKVLMVKKRLISIVLKESNIKGGEHLSEVMKGQPALLLSKDNPFKVARMIAESKTPAPAKPGQVAPRDIIVRAGPTNLPAGPAIGELQRVKIPATIEGDKIAVRSDTTLVKEGQVINEMQANIMMKLGIHPMEMGLDLIAALEDGIVYGKDVLFIPQEQYINDLKAAAQGAFNLSCNIKYYTPYNIKLFISKAHSEAMGLAIEAGIPTKETIKPLVARAHAQGETLREKAHLEPPYESHAHAEHKPEHEHKEEKHEAEHKPEHHEKAEHHEHKADHAHKDAHEHKESHEKHVKQEVE